MNKEFIPYEQALDLKELGFDEPCLARHIIMTEWEKPTGEIILQMTDCLKSDKNLIKAPLKQQVFKFFRKKYNLWVEVKVEDSVKLGTQLYYWLIFGAYKSYEGNDWIRALYESNNKYSTYEEAEQNCLDKLIEICKNK